MIDAANADDESIKTNEPAMVKLMQHKDLFERLKSFQLQEHLLDQDGNLLDALARWLRPSATGLCALEVRNAVYDFIDKLDVDMERDLSSNDLGKVLMTLRKHKLETEANQRRITVRPPVCCLARACTTWVARGGACARACVYVHHCLMPSARWCPPRLQCDGWWSDGKESASERKSERKG